MVPKGRRTVLAQSARLEEDRADVTWARGPSEELCLAPGCLEFSPTRPLIRLVPLHA